MSESNEVKKKALFEQETLNLSDWTVFVFQN